MKSANEIKETGLALYYYRLQFMYSVRLLYIIEPFTTYVLQSMLYLSGKEWILFVVAAVLSYIFGIFKLVTGNSEATVLQQLAVGCSILTEFHNH